METPPPQQSDRPKAEKFSLINRLSLSQKFSIICLLFVVCYAVVTSVMIQEQTRDIHQIRRELAGVDYAQPLTHLFEYIVEHQQTMQRYLSGDTSLENLLLYLEQRMEDSFNSLIDIHERLGPQLFASERGLALWRREDVSPVKLKQEWASIIADSSNLTASSNLQKHDALFTKLRTLSSLVGENAIAVPDTQLASFYLGRSLFTEVPQLQQHLMNAAALAEIALKEKELTSTLRDRIVGIIPLIEQTQTEVTNSLFKAAQIRKVLNEDFDLQASLEQPLAELSAATANFLAAVRKNILLPSKVTLPAGTFSVTTKQVLNESYQFPEVDSEQLERIVTERLRHLEKWRKFCIILSISIATASILISFLLLIVTVLPLRQLVIAARNIAHGNLSTRAPVCGKDEIGHVAESINHLASSVERVIQHLQRSGVQLTTTTTEIAASARQQEATIVEQETATKQIAVTAKEISATAAEFANYIEEVTRSSEETSQLASTGRNGLGRLKDIMKQLVNATTEIADRLSSLNEKTGVITGVITTITKVADRTNLLSLNAAIEAHKLGEKGGSFGVIAAEIRRLADQTAYATLDIEKVVHEMIAAVSSSVDGVAKFSEDIRQGVKQANEISGMLSKIIVQVQAQNESFESVNQGMETQTAGAKQITDSIDELSEAAQQTTSSIRYFHASLDQLGNAIRELQSTVGSLHHQPKSPPPSTPSSGSSATEPSKQPESSPATV